MNEHEIERIASAVHVLRPDWPTASLRTLISKRLADRPRRDITVALAWVACESATSTPARVLEAGPWWKAAGVGGATSNRDNPPKHRRCSVCSLSEERCRQLWSDDHDYAPATADRKRSAEQIRQIVETTKAEVQPMAARPDPRPKPETTDPRVLAARDALAANRPTGEAPRDVRAEARALVHPDAHLNPKHPLALGVDHARVRAAEHRFRPGQPLTWPNPGAVTTTVEPPQAYEVAVESETRVSVDSGATERPAGQNGTIQ